LVTADGGALATPGRGAAYPARPLDEVDDKVIALLECDGRMSCASIGREVGLSEGAVRRRVGRLRAIGAMRVVAIADPAWHGLLVALVGVKATGAVGRLADGLAALPEARVVMATTGTYDIVAEVTCRDQEHLLAVLDEHVRTLPGVTQADAMLCLSVYKGR
jgi:Lrp/AsnC family transcriptional regulator for asnA, asnC and gidA